jgi:allantoinase
MADLVIRGSEFDVAVEGEYISAVGRELPGASLEIDATGLTILPGLIDAHVHFNEPGRADWEGAKTGSRALAAGGGAVFVDMPLNSTPCTVTAADFDEKRAALEAASVADFALWGGLIPGHVKHMAELSERGAVGFKAFLSNSGLPEFPRADDLTLYEGMREAARLGRPVAVHAESEEITAGLSKRLISEGREDVAAFLESRPVVAEVEAIRRAAGLARETGCALHIVHVSSGRGIAAALEARALGADISIETCPHYLFFTEEDLLKIGSVAKCAPPLRSVAERDDLLRRALSGEVDIIGSDHSPCPPMMKERRSFFEIWGGITGVQSTLQVLWELGFDAASIAATTARNPACRFGLRHRGALEVGNYADITLIDTTASHAPTLLHRHKVSPYAGRPLRGVVRRTIRRGATIFVDGAVNNETKGQFIHADNSHAL